MVSILAVVGITLLIMIIGGGGFYLFWLITRPKKMYWQANVYQLGDGVKPPIKDKFGNVISELKLTDLRPYTKDVIQRVERKGGVTYFELQKLGKAVPAVTSDCVDFWGEKEKVVDVLIIEDSCTLLKKGYDQQSGQKIYRPLPHSRINQIKSEIILRKERIQEKKDILQSITPWIVTGIAMLGLVAITYFLITGAVEISERQTEAVKTQVAGQERIATMIANAMVGIPPENTIPVKEEPPPSVE